MSRASWVQETTTSIAGTSGNAAVTLTAVTNTPRFSDAFGTGSRMVNYTIYKASNGYREEGVGVVSGNVLTRTKPRVTWNGTTYDDTGPAALQFGATPTSGDVVIRMSPVAHEFLPAPRAIQTSIGTDPGWIWSAHHGAFGTPGNLFTFATGTEYYTPWLSPMAGYVDGFGIGLDLAGSTGIKGGLYEVGVDGLPGPNIARFNEIINTSTGLRTDTTSGTWAGNPGPLRIGIEWFYIGFVCGDSTCRVSGFGRETGQTISYPPTGRQGGYGFGCMMSKTAENSYATGMPSGTPTGTYSFMGTGIPQLQLRLTN